MWPQLSHTHTRVKFSNLLWAPTVTSVWPHSCSFSISHIHFENSTNLYIVMATEWEQVTKCHWQSLWSLSGVDELCRTAAYYRRCVIEMQKHWQNSFTAIENCVMWKGTQIIASMHAHTHAHTQRQADTHFGKRECHLAPCLKTLFNCSARICTCCLM